MRLIDADELLTAFPADDEPMLTKSCVRMTIQHMPTIRVGENTCKHRTPDGVCKLYTDEHFTSFCVDGPCPNEEPIPEVEPVKHGRWLDDNRRPKSSRFVCSVCGEVAYYPQNHRSDKPRACGYPYCPNCGALMDKEEGEEA